MILHLLNSFETAETLKSKDVKFEGTVNYFNEVMSEGELTEDIFGAEFCTCRSVFHNLPQEDYEEFALRPIEDFLKIEYEELNLYFTLEYEDAINLIAVLAFLDRNAYEGSLILHVIDVEYNVMREVAVAPSGFYSAYNDMLNNRKPAALPPELMTHVDKYMQKRQN